MRQLHFRGRAQSDGRADPGDLAELSAHARLALSYAPAVKKREFAALFLLDALLSATVRSRREIALTQIRLAWWREALGSAEAVTRASHPVLQMVIATLGRQSAEALALVDAWEGVAVCDDSVSAVEVLAEARAAVLATFARSDTGDDLTRAVRRWSLVEAASKASNAVERDKLMTAAAHEPKGKPLSRSLRPVAVLDGLARRAVRRSQPLLIGDRLSPLTAIRLGIFGR